ncbi:restriction endonuclease subunit S [Uliginosibacterium gangwonense]|uniref:restriction endonuclease subunit S n=1 Tax=Uliginosibacterium gangwonense TaxID=392736 RepID=UPI000363F7F0|nr:restriction endonuclease subunit S [Uliginosibacterium gangwonense]
MSSEWQEFSIDEIKSPYASSIAIGPFGSRMKSDCYVKSGISVVRGTNLTSGRELSGEFVFITPEKAQELGGANLEANDLVFPHRGSIGEVGIVPDDGKSYVLSSSLMKLKCDPRKAFPLFIYYFFKSSIGRFELLKNSSQVGTPGIGQPLTSLKSIKLALPGVAEQERIAALLGALDDRIALLRETNATLEAIAQALFKSWFLDFDPVHAKARGEQPEGMPEHLAALFPDSFEESPLGLVPRGWRVLPLEEAYEINPTRKLKKGETAPYLDMASVATSGHTVAGVVEREMGSGTKFVNGDTLLARITPCLENGKTAFVDFLSDDQTGWGSTEFVVLRPKSPLPPYHGYLLSRHPAFREHAIQSMSGTSGRQRVQNDVLGRYPVVVPCVALATAFGDLVGSTQQKIISNHQQAQTLATLRDTLLPRLISGALRLPEAEAAIAEQR